MANLLPPDKAKEQLANATATYISAIAEFSVTRPDHRRARWQDVELAYSKLASAHWEMANIVKSEASHG